MTVTQPPEDAGEPVEKAPDRALPWWTGTRIRLPVLLGCLGIVLLALLGSQNGAHSRSGAGAAASPGWCVPLTPPALAHVPWRQLRALRLSLLSVMEPLARSRYAWGIVAPEDV